ncbi:peptidoglycan binding domain-containing protein [Nocardioides montaniterrae]
MSFWDDSAEPVEVDRRGRARREHAGLTVVLGVVALLAVVLALAYAALYAVAGDRVPRGAVVSGVDVGGKGHDDAVDAVAIAFRARAQQPIVLSAADATGAERTVSVRPSAIGLAVDAEASVDQLGARRSWSPARLWDYFAGGDDRAAVVRLDRDKLAAVVRTMRGGLGGPPVNARVVFTKDGPHTVPGRAGDAIDLDAAASAVSSAFLTGATRAQVPLDAAEPEIDAAGALDGLGVARPAMAAPVVLRFGPKAVTLRPAEFAKALAMRPADGRLVLAVRRGPLLALVKAQRRSIEPRDAAIRLVHGRPQVVPARAGLAFTDDAVVAAFRRTVSEVGKRRTASVAARRAQPSRTTAEVRALGVGREVAAATTYAHGARASDFKATGIDGRLVLPGADLTLHGAGAPVVTTVAQAGFFAGLRNMAPTVPIGSSGGALRLRNDSRYAVLVDVTTTPGSIRVRMFSTRTWTISLRKGEPLDRVPAGVRADYSPGCRPLPGRAGYVLPVTRVFRHAGFHAVDHTDATFRWLHPPVPRVVCP